MTQDELRQAINSLLEGAVIEDVDVRTKTAKKPSPGRWRELNDSGDRIMHIRFRKPLTDCKNNDHKWVEITASGDPTRAFLCIYCRTEIRTPFDVCRAIDESI